jgi:hypothetical protein
MVNLSHPYVDTAKETAEAAIKRGANYFQTNKSVICLAEVNIVSGNVYTLKDDVSINSSNFSAVRERVLSDLSTNDFSTIQVNLRGFNTRNALEIFYTLSRLRRDTPFKIIPYDCPEVALSVRQKYHTFPKFPYVWVKESSDDDFFDIQQLSEHTQVYSECDLDRESDIVALSHCGWIDNVYSLKHRKWFKESID